MSGSAYVHRVAVAGINQNAGDALAVVQAYVGPVLAAVGGFVNALSDRGTVTRPAFAGSNPDDLMVRRIDRHRADRLHGLMIEYRFEGCSPVDRLPDSSACRADKHRHFAVVVKGVDGGNAAAHGGGTDIPRIQAGNGPGIEFDGTPVTLRGGDRDGKGEDGKHAEHKGRQFAQT